MKQDPTYDTLNELLAAERRSLLPRLAEAMVFITPDSAPEWAALQRLAQEHTSDESRLARTLIDLGGNPRPLWGDVHSADFHYTDLDHVLPRVLEREQEIAARYDTAFAELADCPPALEVVRDIAARHRTCIESLTRLVSHVVH